MKKKYIKPVSNVACVKLAMMITVVSLPQESVDDITVGSRELFNSDWHADEEEIW